MCEGHLSRRDFLRVGFVTVASGLLPTRAPSTSNTEEAAIASTPTAKGTLGITYIVNPYRIEFDKSRLPKLLRRFTDHFDIRAVGRACIISEYAADICVAFDDPDRVRATIKPDRLYLDENGYTSVRFISLPYDDADCFVQFSRKSRLYRV